MWSEAATYDFISLRSWLTALFALTGPYCGSAGFSVELLSDNCFGRWGECSSFSPHRFFVFDRPRSSKVKYSLFRFEAHHYCLKKILDYCLTFLNLKACLQIGWIGRSCEHNRILLGSRRLSNLHNKKHCFLNGGCAIEVVNGRKNRMGGEWSCSEAV